MSENNQERTTTTMTSEDDFLKLGTPKKEEKPTPTTNQLLQSGSVVEHKLMTLTTYKEYPNGMRTPPTSKSWWVNREGVAVKKKQSKKKLSVKQAVLQKEESY